MRVISRLSVNNSSQRDHYKIQVDVDYLGGGGGNSKCDQIKQMERQIQMVRWKACSNGGSGDRDVAPCFHHDR